MVWSFKIKHNGRLIPKLHGERRMSTSNIYIFLQGVLILLTSNVTTMYKNENSI